MRAEMLEIEEVVDEAGLAALEPTWRALVDATPHATPFQTWEWLSTWWEHHRSGKLWVLVARDKNVAVGLMPLTRTWYRVPPLRQVRWMGAPLSDFQDIVGPPDRQAECTRAFLAHLAKTRSLWDVCDLNDLLDGSALPSAPFASSDEHLRGETVFHRMCPVISLAPSWEEYSKSLGKNLRANVGRRRRQLEKAYRTELDTVHGDALPAAMNDLFHLHNTRWRRRGVGGAFSGERIQAFHHEVARKFDERGWLKLHRLRCDGSARALFYCFQLGGRVYYYLSGFDDSISKFSPGNVLMGYSVQQAIADGAREFDLLRGDETYKYAWKAVDRKTVRMILRHGSMRSRLAFEGHRVERFVEQEGLKLQRRMWGRQGQTGKGAPAADGAKLSEPDQNNDVS